VETAQRLFAEFGYDATSLQMIADAMGLTKAAVYYYFRVKSEILFEIVMPGIQRLEGLLDEVATMRSRRARTEHLVNGYVDFLIENRKCPPLATADPAAKRNKLDEAGAALRRRALTLLFGDNPTGAERLAFSLTFSGPDRLPDLADLSDEELREALQTTLLRTMRIPS